MYFFFLFLEGFLVSLTYEFLVVLFGALFWNSFCFTLSFLFYLYLLQSFSVIGIRACKSHHSCFPISVFFCRRLNAIDLANEGCLFVCWVCLWVRLFSLSCCVSLCLNGLWLRCSGGLSPLMNKKPRWKWVVTTKWSLKTWWMFDFWTCWFWIMNDRCMKINEILFACNVNYYRLIDQCLNAVTGRAECQIKYRLLSAIT